MGAGRLASRVQIFAGLLIASLLTVAEPTGQAVFVALVSVGVCTMSASFLFGTAIRLYGRAPTRNGRYMSPRSQPRPKPIVLRKSSPAEQGDASEPAEGTVRDASLASAHPFTTALIVHWGSTDPTVRFVRELGKLNSIDEVVVVANDLSPRPRELDTSAIWIVPPRNLGFAGGFDYGRRSLPGADYYLLLNNDVEIHEDCVAECHYVLKDPSIGVVAPVLMNSGGVQSAVGFVSRPLFKAKILGSVGANRVSDAEWVTGAVMFIRARCLEQVGFNLSYFLIWEDADFCFRVRNEGWRVVIASRARAWHQGGATIPSTRGYYYSVRNRVWFSRRWGTRSQAFLVWLLIALVLTPRVFLADIVKRRNIDNGLSVLRGLLDALKTLPGEDTVPIGEPYPARWGH
jgi:N-acetylglucosaminyl-diphospho-decaprenol L-rhamnosyltransferase